MDPLFDAQMVFGWARPDTALIERADDEGWFDLDPDPEELYRGRRVDWVGRPGHMLKVEWDQLQATQMNPFEPGKVRAFERMMRDGDYIADAPSGMVTTVDLDDVSETQQLEEEELPASYGMTRPFTTGDDDLDEFLADPEEFLEDNADSDEDAESMRADMTVRAEDALNRCEGDLGKTVVYLRDGNHRAMAAQLAGEPYVWVDVRWHSPAELHHVGLAPEDFE